MPAAATARKTAAAPRRAPAHRRATARRPAARSAGAPRAPRPVPAAHGRLVPVAVGRAGVAVGGLADSGFVLGLTRSRMWIGVLAGLLVGIVALNVAALQFNASASKTAAISDELRRENSALRAQIAGELSNERLQQAASRLGLIVPEPGATLYLRPSPGDAAAAADRLRRGEVTLGSAYAAVPVEPVAVSASVPAEEAAVAAVEPAAAEEAVAAEPAETAEPAPVATDPAAATVGGIAP